MGFSDNTNLTYTLATIAEVPTIYGPNFQAFAFLPLINSTLDVYNLLTNKTKSIKVTSANLGIKRCVVTKIINESGLKHSNQKYVIRYDKNHYEIKQ